MVDRPVGNPTSKDPAVGRFKVSRYLEWRQREGSAIVPRCAGFPLSLTRTAGVIACFSGRSKAFMEVEDSASVRSIHDQCAGIWLQSFCVRAPRASPQIQRVQTV